MGRVGPKGSEVRSELVGNNRVPRQGQGSPVQEGLLDKGKVTWVPRPGWGHLGLEGSRGRGGAG